MGPARNVFRCPWEWAKRFLSGARHSPEGVGFAKKTLWMDEAVRQVVGGYGGNSSVLTGILSSIAATLIVLLITAAYRFQWAKLLRRAGLRLLTKRGITEVRTYIEILPRVQELLGSRLANPELNVLNVLGFMGHDLTYPKDRLVEHTKGFLQQGGTANFLLSDPESPFVEERAKLLNMSTPV